MEIMHIYTLYNIAIKLVRHSHWCLFNFNSIRCVFYFTLRNRNLHMLVRRGGGGVSVGIHVCECKLL